MPVTILGHPLLGCARALGVVRPRARGGRPHPVRHAAASPGTAHPALSSGGPVTFVTDSEGALVRPIDFAPGYLIPDGEPARAAPGHLTQAGRRSPARIRGTCGFRAAPANDRMVRSGWTGAAPVRRSPHRPRARPSTRRSSRSLTRPGTCSSRAIGGVYDVRPSGTSRVTTGTVLAVGPTRWLTAVCNNHARCRPVVIDRPTGVRYPLNTRVPLSTRLNGAVASTARRDLTRRGHCRSPGWIAAGNDRDHRPRYRHRTCASAPYRLVRSRHRMGMGIDGLVAGQRWLFIATATSTRSANVPAKSPPQPHARPPRCRNFFSYRCGTSRRADRCDLQLADIA